MTTKKPTLKQRKAAMELQNYEFEVQPTTWRVSLHGSWVGSGGTVGAASKMNLESAVRCAERCADIALKAADKKTTHPAPATEGERKS